MAEILNLKTSIVILTYNQLEYTKACIQSIRQYTQKGTYEVIMVDNASTDGTREWLAEQTDLMTIFNDENVGFSRGCNQGMELSHGDAILLLNNDVLVTANWLPLLLECLYSSDRIGAVGPITNSAFGYQDMPVPYKTIDEMWGFAAANNKADPSQWEPRVKLMGFCMMFKREIMDTIGMLDESSALGSFEDVDYSFRIIKAGYQIRLARNVFVHHFGSVSFNNLPEEKKRKNDLNRKRFQEKWGFSTTYYTKLRYDLIELFSTEDLDKPIRVLDIGCGFGVTLLQIKHKFKLAEIYGVEKNEQVAAMAKAATLADIRALDVEQSELDYPDQSFDYIVLGNVLEQLYQPLELLRRIKRLLKPRGTIVASFPNVMNFRIIESLLNGNWSYTEEGPLDRRNLRFFTIGEMKKLFDEAGYSQLEYASLEAYVSDGDKQLLQGLVRLSEHKSEEQFSAYQYLFRAHITKPETRVEQLIHDVETLSAGVQIVLDELAMGVRSGSFDNKAIIAAVQAKVSDKQKMYNVLTRTWCQHGMYEHVVPLLNASLQIDNTHRDTLFNFAYLMHKIEADDKALHFLSYIQNHDAESSELLRIVKANLQEV